MKSFSLKAGLVGGLSILVLATVGCDGRQSGKSVVGQSTFRVESVKLDSEQIAKVDEFGLTSAKKFQFSACLSDVVSRSPIQLVNFAVSDGVNQQTRLTQSSGCLIWEEVHDVSALQKERKLHVQRTFIGKGIFKGSVTVDLALNPWNIADFADLRFVQPPDVEQQVQNFSFGSGLAVLDTAGTSSGGFSTLPFLNQLTLDFLGQDKASTQINTLLTLKIAEKFRLSMHPQFSRLNIKNQPVFVDLKDGKFQLRVVVLTEDAATTPMLKNLVASYDGEVQVMPNGDVTKDITLRVYDTASLLSRNKIFVILTPMGRASHLASLGAYSGYISPINGVGGTAKLIPEAQPSVVAQGIADILAQAQKPSMTGTEMLKAHAGLALVRADFGQRMVQDVKLAPGTGERTNLMAALCRYMYAGVPSMTTEAPKRTLSNPKTWLHKQGDPLTIPMETLCSKSPESMVTLESHDFVESVNGNPTHVELLSANDRTINIGRVVSLSQSNSDTVGDDFSKKGEVDADASVSANVNAKVFASFGPPSSSAANMVGLMSGNPTAAAGGSGLIGSPWLSVGGGAGASLSAALTGTAHMSIGKDWYEVQSQARTSSTTVSATVSQNQTASVVSDSYDLSVTARRCVLSRPVYATATHAGMYICDGKTSDRRIRETYYLINHSRPASAFADPDSALDSQNLRMTIRGQQTYQAFEKMLTTDNKVLNFRHAFVNADQNSLVIQSMPDLKTTQSFPGMVSE